jgi:adenylylsulfate kinase
MKDSNIAWHDLSVHKSLRAKMKNQTPCIIWLTGLSGSGKSSIACAVEKKLALYGQHTYMLDGDNVRHDLCKDLGFSHVDREENIRRVAEVSHLMVDAGLIVLCAFISPFRAGRNLARSMFDDKEFIEVYMDTPIALCEERDPKGLYKKARAGEITDFTGIDSPYEAPLNPELTIVNNGSIEQAANQVINYLITQEYLGSNVIKSIDKAAL